MVQYTSHIVYVLNATPNDANKQKEDTLTNQLHTSVTKQTNKQNRHIYVYHYIITNSKKSEHHTNVDM